MSTKEFTPEELGELVPLARAAAGESADELWENIGGFFQEQRGSVEKRPNTKSD